MSPIAKLGHDLAHLRALGLAGLSPRISAKQRERPCHQTKSDPSQIARQAARLWGIWRVCTLLVASVGMRRHGEVSPSNHIQL